MTTTHPPDQRLDGPVHGWFGLSYSNYLVLPRTLMQSMPEGWQDRMVACLDEMHDAFSHVEQAKCYEVTAGVEREVGDLSDAELAHLGISRDPDGDEKDPTFWDRDGNEMQAWERVVWPKPDPVPHYNRGRTYIEPQAGR